MPRFDDQTYLDVYRKRGRFPAIHSQLADLIVAESRSTRLVDLGACTGLLGQQVMRRLRDAVVVGVEANGEFIKRGKAAGVTVPTLHAPLTPETVPSIGDWIRSFSVTALIARRCLPEIFGQDDKFRAGAGKMFREFGITEIFIEGRQPTRNATNVLCDIVKEVAIFKKQYRIGVLRGAFAYLIARK